MSQRVSIWAVAKKAKCSIATVSNVLNKKGRVGPVKRKLVLRAAQELGYQTNSAGRSLRTSKTEMIGLLFNPSCAQIFKNPFYAEIMEGVEEKLTSERYNLLLAGYHASVAESEVPDFLTRGKVDGMILLGRFPTKIIESFSHLKSPLLLLDSNVEWPIDSIISDGFTGETNVVNHLYAHGHRNIVMLAYPMEDYNIDLRVQGFLAGMRKCGLDASERSLMRDEISHDVIYPALRARMKGPNPPTAVVAVNDTLAVAMMKRLNADGLSVPGDISMVGYDDDIDMLTIEQYPYLTTVRVNKGELGRIGAEMILNRMKTPDAPAAKLRLPVELIERKSVATLAV